MKDVARYDVMLRLRTGWPVSASGLIHLREVGRSMPGRTRLRRILTHTEGFTELTLRMTGIPPEMAIHQARLTLPRFDIPREILSRIEVRRSHLLPNHGTLLITWSPRRLTSRFPPPSIRPRRVVD
jgi:hypothetical protein